MQGKGRGIPGLSDGLTHEWVSSTLCVPFLAAIRDSHHYPTQGFPRGALCLLDTRKLTLRNREGRHRLITLVMGFKQALPRNPLPSSPSIPQLSDWCLLQALALSVHLKHAYKVTLFSPLLTLPAPQSASAPSCPNKKLLACLLLLLSFSLFHLSSPKCPRHNWPYPNTLRGALRDAVWC